jgi:hypothetical protein
MRLPQFTLRIGMVAVAVISIGLAIWARKVAPGELCLIIISIAVISRFPYRVRLLIEVAIVLFLLLLTMYVHYSRFHGPSRFYGNQADRVAKLARQASDWAVDSTDPQARSILRRESAWFARRAVSLRRIAIVKGLSHGPNYPEGRRTLQENRDILDMLWEIQRHEDAAKQAHK